MLCPRGQDARPQRRRVPLGAPKQKAGTRSEAWKTLGGPRFPNWHPASCLVWCVSGQPQARRSEKHAAYSCACDRGGPGQVRYGPPHDPQMRPCRRSYTTSCHGLGQCRMGQSGTRQRDAAGMDAGKSYGCSVYAALYVGRRRCRLFPGSHTAHWLEAAILRLGSNSGRNSTQALRDRPQNRPQVLA